MAELIVRFVAGGAIVTLFALIGEVWKPKSFGGLFGAAPSVALVSLGLAFASHDPSYVAKTATAMIGGSAALFVYASACVAATRLRGVPVWVEATIAWVCWFAPAAAIYVVFRASGIE